MIDRLSYFYAHENSNIHRAAHELAARAADAYEGARNTVATFIGASSSEEIIFVRGATEGINLVAKTWGVKNVGEGDEIIVSHLEHHANIVPWQQLAAEKGARIRVIPVDGSGQVLLGEYQRLLNARTRIVAVTRVSNALGTVVPVQEIVALVDGAQSVSHMAVDVQQIDADFFIFILRQFGLEATVRPSLAFYNTCEDVDRLVQVVRRLAGVRARCGRSDRAPAAAARSCRIDAAAPA